MNNDIAISVRNISKAYTIRHNAEQHTMLSEAIMHTLRNPLRRQEKETFWALKDISFDVKKGDVVGIIGRNGAGKSTLLKILSRITEPTTGEILMDGRVGSLLEVGTGFHPELTGRENIYLNGAILGMKRREIDRHFDAIVDFAGVEQFLDTPVKRYSSGMYVRLAFAVAAHLNPEILIVDEVLSVGDAEFQKKCLGKMGEVAKSGRTVLFVSHNMEAVRKLCNHGIMLLKGNLASNGITIDIINNYINSGIFNSSEYDIDVKNKFNMNAYAYHISIEDMNNRPIIAVKVGEPWQIRIKICVVQKIDNLVVGMGLNTINGFSIRTTWTEPFNANVGEYEIIFSDKYIMLEPGYYSIIIGLSQHAQTFQYVTDAGFVNIIDVTIFEEQKRYQRIGSCGLLINPMNVIINHN